MPFLIRSLNTFLRYQHGKGGSPVDNLVELLFVVQMAYIW